MKLSLLLSLVLFAFMIAFGMTGCQKQDGISSPALTNSPKASDDVATAGVKAGGRSILCFGCTRTPGYWKTHSEFGPAPADPAWYNLPGGLGPNTVLYGTGLTYYQLLWVRPRGNAYFILSYQFIATRLNKYAGASVDPSSVLDAYNHAHVLLDQYDGSPYPMSDITGAVRDDFIQTASILDQYNNGLIGPGHCPD